MRQFLKVYINWAKECFNSHSNLQIVTIFTVKNEKKKTNKHKIIVVNNKQKSYNLFIKNTRHTKEIYIVFRAAMR